jgi:hypothetical protein
MIALKKKISPKFIQAHVTKEYGKDLINAGLQNLTYIDETGRATMIFFIVQSYISEDSIRFTITSPGLEKFGNRETLENSIFKYVTQDITKYKRFMRNDFKVFCNNIQIL